MFEKVNPSHPDKIADRIAGALVDYAYAINKDPHIAVEVLIGHGHCYIIEESNLEEMIPKEFIEATVERITNYKHYTVNYIQEKQDSNLAKNQENIIKCGDNGIFKGVPVTFEERTLTKTVEDLYQQYPYDGKYILDNKSNRLVCCQSHITKYDMNNFKSMLGPAYYSHNIDINPLGYWVGSPDVDTGATNRKLGSDMGLSVTGGGLHGKDFSKADVSLNIYAWLKAQSTGQEVNISCAIGDTEVDGYSYSDIVNIAKDYITSIGGFERFAEWGLLR